MEYKNNRKEGDRLIEIAVCDDEKVIREQIAALLEKQGADCRIELFATGDELLAVKRRYDMIFLDIQMEGRNGIKTARAIRGYDEQAVVVFVTAIKESVFEAFDVGAFHYLLKPIKEEKFAEVFAAAKRRIEKRGREGEETPMLFLEGRKRSVALKQKDILYIESRSNKVAIHTVKGEIEAWRSIRKLEGELGGSFYRCHRGYLVNMAHISEYGGDMIDMDNGGRVYLAREKYSDFVRAYLRYLDGGGAEDA